MLWSGALETGIPKIDEQHQELFRQADVLLDNSRKDRIPETLKFLGEYVLRHFTDEQVMHSTSRYPKAEAHKKFHAAFIDEFKRLKKEYEDSGHNLTIVLKINQAVVGWLKDHIMVHDKEFAAFYKSR